MKFTGFEKFVAAVLVCTAILTIALTVGPYQYLHAT